LPLSAAAAASPTGRAVSTSGVGVRGSDADRVGVSGVDDAHRAFAPRGSRWPAGRTFRAVRVLDNGEVRRIVPGTSIRVTFRQQNQLTIRAGCNIMFGGGTIFRGRLHVRGLGSTRMFCSEPRMDQERWVHDLITQRPRFLLAGHRLILHRGWGATELRLTEVRAGR
jgi:heat shock protein HslJ